MDQSLLKRKSAGVAWEFMYTRSMFNTPDMIEQHHLLNRVSAWLDAGKLKCTANEVRSPINAENLRWAHQTLEAGHTIGKIVLAGWE